MKSSASVCPSHLYIKVYVNLLYIGFLILLLQLEHYIDF